MAHVAGRESNSLPPQSEAAQKRLGSAARNPALEQETLAWDGFSLESATHSAAARCASASAPTLYRAWVDLRRRTTAATSSGAWLVPLSVPNCSLRYMVQPA